jgi:hypothetical protein
MTRCAVCGSRARWRTGRVYVAPDGSRALVLCGSCRSTRPASRQYQPSSGSLPERSEIDLTGVGVTDP